ncbi:hypothetical protein N7481_013309 [Penicillium waksmanii]|uniref:uncharacterized protein n=1 Tax=Penicillium waksmanii TaxID=69791 RepID=UPI002546E639|nr:uncharacterized protein N7481_013309 [Penicillium waksmanii]KAJ5966595.1 hypothetical protein N7481_013309 [Penicillium waksmanii]
MEGHIEKCQFIVNAEVDCRLNSVDSSILEFLPFEELLIRNVDIFGLPFNNLKSHETTKCNIEVVGGAGADVGAIKVNFCIDFRYQLTCEDHSEPVIVAIEHFVEGIGPLRVVGNLLKGTKRILDPKSEGHRGCSEWK